MYENLRFHSGVKSFKELGFNDNITIGGLLNNVNITYLYQDTLLTQSPYIQVVKSGKKFQNNVTMNSMTSYSTVDDTDIQPNKFLTLHTSQEVQGNVRFSNNFTADHVTVNGKYTGCDIEQTLF